MSATSTVQRTGSPQDGVEGAEADHNGRMWRDGSPLKRDIVERQRAGIFSEL